jgi:hypothetical protein
LWPRQFRKLLGRVFHEHRVGLISDAELADPEFLEAYFYAMWTAPLRETRHRKMTWCLSWAEQTRMVRLAVEYVLDPTGPERHRAQQRERGLYGAMCRWGAKMDPRLLLLPECAGMTEFELAEYFECSRSTIQRMKRELHAADRYGTTLSDQEILDLRELVVAIRRQREVNRRERFRRRRAWAKGLIERRARRRVSLVHWREKRRQRGEFIPNIRVNPVISPGLMQLLLETQC